MSIDVPPDQPCQIKEGMYDKNLGRWVVDLIYTSGQKSGFQYAIYLDDELGIQWFVNCGQSDNGFPLQYYPADFGEILSDVVHLETQSEGLRREQGLLRKRRNKKRAKAAAATTGTTAAGTGTGSPEEPEQAARPLVVESPSWSPIPGPPVREDEVRDFRNYRQQERVLRASRRLIAEALARAIGDIGADKAQSLLTTTPHLEDSRSTTAKRALQLAQDYVKARASDRGREWVIKGALVAVAACLVTLVLLRICYQFSADGQAEQIKLDTKLGLQLDTIKMSGAQDDSPSTGADGKPAAAAPSASIHSPLGWLFPTVVVPHTSSVEKWMGWMNNEGWDVIKFSLLGSLGAMLSVLMNAYKRNYDAGAGSGVLMAEGGIRIIVGVLGAAFITLGIKSGVFMGFLEKVGNNPAAGATAAADLATTSKYWLMCLMGFAAGLSEQLVPSFISLVEAQVQAPKQK